METTDLGMEVRRARNAMGLTLQQLGDKADLSVTTVHSIETGRSRYPAQETLRALGDALEPETSFRHLALKVYGLELVPA